jgi:hypothetical protein
MIVLDITPEWEMACKQELMRVGLLYASEPMLNRFTNTKDSFVGSVIILWVDPFNMLASPGFMHNDLLARSTAASN